MMAVVAVAADCQRQVTPDVTVGRTIRVGGMDTRGLYGARARLRAERSSRGDAGSVECAQRHVRALLLGSYSSCWRGDVGAVRSLQVGCGVRGRVDLWHGPMSRCRGGCCARWHVLDPTPLHIYTQLWRVRSVRCLLRAAGRVVCARDLHLCEMRAQSRTQLWRGPGGWRGARNRSQRAATRRRRERSVRPAAVRGGLRRGVVGEGDAEFPPDFYVAVRTMVRTLGTNSCELGNYFYEHYIQ